MKKTNKGKKRCPVCAKMFALRGLPTHIQTHTAQGSTYEHQVVYEDIQPPSEGQGVHLEESRVVVIQLGQRNIGFLIKGNHLEYCEVTIVIP